MITRNLDETCHSNRITALGQLAISLAHEVSQPLAAILANSETAMALVEKPSPNLPELQAVLADIREDARRAGELIRNLRSLLQKGRARTHSVDLNAVMDHSLKMVRNTAAWRQVRLDVELTPCRVRVNGDPIQLQQVLLNLLSNAMDALQQTPPALRWIAIRTVPVLEERRVLIEVEDSGPGIPLSLREQIFEPFYTSKADGLGVGLSISRSIVEAHGGRIWVEEGEKGARFRVALPLALDASEQPAF